MYDDLIHETDGTYTVCDPVGKDLYVYHGKGTPDEIENLSVEKWKEACQIMADREFDLEEITLEDDGTATVNACPMILDWDSKVYSYTVKLRNGDTAADIVDRIPDETLYEHFSEEKRAQERSSSGEYCW